MHKLIWARIIKYFFALLLLLLNNAAFCQQSKSVRDADTRFRQAVNRWFTAWQLVSQQVYGIKKSSPVSFVFFDEQFVYSTSPVTIPVGTVVNGPSLLQQRLSWKRAPHGDSIVLPNKSTVPVGLMSYASQVEGSNEAFFVMPLPSFWKAAGVTSKELGLEQMITGVFIHEFAHSQQMKNFGRRISAFEQQNEFGVELTDDIIQTLFGKDSVYTSLFRKEADILYKAAAAKEKGERKHLVEEGMRMMQQRYAAYFTGRYHNLKEMDVFFLTMEGIGQYSMYVWLTHPKGGRLPKETALKGVRRGGRWWSQEEGLALFLILSELSSPRHWVGGMFGESIDSVTDLIQKQYNTR